jgi:ferrous iron transport protein B
MEPLFAPLGLDWRYGVAILTSFLAREVFVGTLGCNVRHRGGRGEHGAAGGRRFRPAALGLASGVALLVFFAVALMCVSTLAILSRETGSTSLAVRMFVAYVGMAYIMSIVAFQVVSLLGG